MKPFFISMIALLCISGCAWMKKKDPDPSLDFLKRPMTQEENERVASEAGGNWLYGQGFGDAALSIGGIVLFPPYALYVLGNGAISLSGYEPLYVTNLLPDDARAGYNQFYDGVASGPGRLSAAIAGEEYRNTDVVRERYKNLLKEPAKQNKGASGVKK